MTQKSCLFNKTNTPPQAQATQSSQLYTPHSPLSQKHFLSQDFSHSPPQKKFLLGMEKEPLDDTHVVANTQDIEDGSESDDSEKTLVIPETQFSSNGPEGHCPSCTCHIEKNEVGIQGPPLRIEVNFLDLDLAEIDD